jgi:hypothetical protein
MRRPFWTPATLFALIAMIVSGIHLLVGDVGWFFRYEDYMVMLLGVGLIMQLWDVFSEPRPAGALQIAAVAVALIFCLGAVMVDAHRGDGAVRGTPWAMKNIYDQQYQLAHFLKANPRYASVAIGDLGAITYYNDNLRVIDLEGLALRGVPLRSLGRYRMHPPLIRQLTKRNNASIAIVFTDYFDQPKEWRQVGTWTIEKDIVTYQPTVGFYAIPPTDPAALEQALKAYSQTELPKDVHAQFPN